MSDIQPVTWYDDPSHFRKNSRREFIFAGLVGGLGLTLGDFFKLRAAQTSTPGIVNPPVVAKSLIHIFMAFAFRNISRTPRRSRTRLRWCAP